MPADAVDDAPPGSAASAGGKTGAETDGETGGKAGAKAGRETGGKTSSDTNAETGSGTGGEADAETSGKTGGETGAEAGGETGSDSGARTGGEVGAETSGLTSSDTGGDAGTGTGGDVGSGAGGKTGGETGGASGPGAPGRPGDPRKPGWSDGPRKPGRPGEPRKLGRSGRAGRSGRPELPGQSGRSAAYLKARRRRRARTAFEAYLLLAPSLFGFLAFLVAPVVIVFVLSLFSWNLITSPQFVGLANYRRMFGDSQSWHALLNTAYYVVLNIPIQTVLALLLALALNRKVRGSKFFRVLFVLPWMAMPVALGVIWNWFFDPRSGIIDHVISLLGFTGPNWLTSTTWAMPVIASVNVWQYTGYTMLFLLAGLQAIPQQVYEAAALDGTNAVQRFFRITLPLLRPSMFFVLVTNVIGSFQQFDTVYVMTQGGPGQSTTTMNYYIYQQAFQLFHAGYAATLSILLFAVILLVTIVQFRYFRKRTIYDFS